MSAGAPLLGSSGAGAQPRPAFRLFPPTDIHEFIPVPRWRIFRAAMRSAQAHGIPFSIAGGLAVSLYTGFWRCPHDLDLLIVPQDRERMTAALAASGLHDYYDTKPYDRGWIYRASRDDTVVDAIWALANGVGDVDDVWVERGPEGRLADMTIRLVPPEELIWSKLYVMQGERCDWPDIVNVLFASGADLDWERLIARCAGDETLLASVASLFAWIAPGRARALPDWVWPRLRLARPAEYGPQVREDRIERLDTRPWFSPAARETAD